MENATVKINAPSLAIIYRHAEETFPYECCGFLYGQEQNGRYVTLAAPVANSKSGDKRRRFEVSPLEYMKAENFAIENGLELLGVYHSHPNHPAIASEHDLAAAMPYFSYVIVSVMEGKVADIKSWRLRDEAREFSEEVVEIETAAAGYV